MFWCVDGTPIWATLVNLDLWNLFIAIVSFGLTYQVRIMTLASTVFKKINFQKNSHWNALGSKFDLDVKYVKVNLGSSFEQTYRPHIHNATYQVPRSSAFSFRRRFLNGFNHIWAWWPSWSCDQNILHKFWLTYHKESSHEIWVQLGQWFVRKLCFDILMGLQYERPKLKGQRSTLTFETYL